jgi:hypothetical protein
MLKLLIGGFLWEKMSFSVKHHFQEEKNWLF